MTSSPQNYSLLLVGGRNLAKTAQVRTQGITRAALARQRVLRVTELVRKLPVGTGVNQGWA